VRESTNPNSQNLQVVSIAVSFVLLVSKVTEELTYPCEDVCDDSLRIVRPNRRVRYRQIRKLKDSDDEPNGDSASDEELCRSKFKRHSSLLRVKELTAVPKRL